jgi:hypothetical protein
MSDPAGEIAFIPRAALDTQGAVSDCRSAFLDGILKAASCFSTDHFGSI